MGRSGTVPTVQHRPLGGCRVVVTDLTVSFGGVTAIDQVSFEADPGKVTLIAGPCGSGKSAVLRTLVGLVTPDSGSVLFDDRRYADLKDPVWTVGAVLQATGGWPFGTARAHLRAAAMAAGLPRQRVTEVLESSGLQHLADVRLRGWSDDLVTRLNIAAACLGEPSVFVFDDVGAALDEESAAWLGRRMTGWAEAGGTVVMSTRLPSLWSDIADKTVRLNNGRVVGEDRR